jgi:hypothetical protein|tara:strand:- start:473 stop:814 length:342 start_codon:yes stop_codon:yes gene_type:complete
MLYTIEAIFKGINKRNIKYEKDGEQKEFTLNQIVLENPNNIKDMLDVDFNDQNFKIDEDKFKNKTVVCPCYLNKNEKNGKIYYNWKLRGDISLAESSSKGSKEDDLNEGLFKR